MNTAKNTTKTPTIELKPNWENDRVGTAVKQLTELAFTASPLAPTCAELLLALQYGNRYRIKPQNMLNLNYQVQTMYVEVCLTLSSLQTKPSDVLLAGHMILPMLFALYPPQYFGYGKGFGNAA